MPARPIQSLLRGPCPGAGRPRSDTPTASDPPSLASAGQSSTCCKRAGSRARRCHANMARGAPRRPTRHCTPPTLSLGHGSRAASPTLGQSGVPPSPHGNHGVLLCYTGGTASAPPPHARFEPGHGAWQSVRVERASYPHGRTRCFSPRHSAHSLFLRFPARAPTAPLPQPAPPHCRATSTLAAHAPPPLLRRVNRWRILDHPGRLTLVRLVGRSHHLSVRGATSAALCWPYEGPHRPWQHDHL